MTATIQIGNTDDKLTQNEWSDFVREARVLIEEFSTNFHFSGGSSNWEKWQNVCWVVEISETKLNKLEVNLVFLRQGYKQDSVAITTGITRFI